MAKAAAKPQASPEATPEVAPVADQPTGFADDVGMDQLNSNSTLAEVAAVMENPDEKVDVFALADASDPEPKFIDDEPEEAAEEEQEVEGDEEADEVAAETAEDATETDAELEAKAKAWDDFAASFAENPVAAMRDFLSQLQPEQRELLAKEVAVETVSIADDYEPVNEVEQAVFSKRDWLINGEAKMRNALAEVTQAIAPSVQAAGLEVEALRAQVGALCEVLGLTLPAVMWDPIAADVRNGKATTYKEVIDKHYQPHLKKVLADYAKTKQREAQANKQRPPKSDSVSARLSKVDSNSSYTDLAREFGIL